MSFKEAVKKVWSIVYVRHFTYAMCILAGVTVIVMISLGFYTRHGAKIQVPDVKGVSVESAQSTLESKGLRCMVVDSVYIRDKAPGTVIEQVPATGQNVKPNRIIFLTVNSVNKRMIVLPNLIDISIRQAQSLITSMGLQVGYVKTAPSDFKDLVIDATCNGRSVRQGSRVPDGAVINFVVGDGNGEVLQVDTLASDETIIEDIEE